MSKTTSMLRIVAAAGAAASFLMAGTALGQNAKPAAAPAPVKDAAQPAKDAAHTQPEAGPKPGFIPGAQLPEAIKLEKNQFDWGEISDQKPVDYDFSVQNITEETIKISIAASCGCTVPMVEKNTLAPGETTKAKAQFNPKGRSGTQTKTVTITVIEPTQKYASQSIVLTSTVKALVTLDPPKVHLPEVDHRSGATSKLTVTGRKEGFAVLSAESNNPAVVAKIGEPKQVEVGGEKLTSVDIEIEAGKGANIGDIMAQLTLKTNDDRVEPMQVMVSAQIVGTARANPSNAFLRVFTPSTPFSTQIRIDSRNGTAFKIRSVEVDSRDDMSLATDVVAGEGGKYYMLTLAGVTPATPGYVQGTLVIDTDVDGGEVLRIPFSASIRNPTPAPVTKQAPVNAVPTSGAQKPAAVPLTGTQAPSALPTKP